MKRFRLFILAVVLCLLPALCFGFVGLKTVASAQVIAAGQSFTSAAVPTADIFASEGRSGVSAAGYFSVQLTVAGTGTARVEVLVSNDGTNFQEADGASDVMTGKTVGTSLASFTVPACKEFKLKITETGGANAVTVTAIVAAI